MNNKNNEYRQKLNEIIIAKRQELEHRQNRLNNNIFAGICHKSIIAQRKTILYLEIQINNLEYKLQHNL